MKDMKEQQHVILFRPVVVVVLNGETQNHVEHNGKYLRSFFINQEQSFDV